MRAPSLKTTFTFAVIAGIVTTYIVSRSYANDEKVQGVAHEVSVMRSIPHLRRLALNGISSPVLATIRPAGRDIGTVSTWGPHPSSDRAIAARFQRRRELVQSACRRYFNASAFSAHNETLLNESRLKNIMKYTVYLCHIRKSASTTLIHTFKRIRKKTPLPDISATRVSMSSSYNEESVVFVREPYSRLFSGYIDKLFYPCTSYWNMIGRYIVSNFRPNASSVSKKCGHDVTFSEFIKYFIHMQHTGERSDHHFKPMHQCCPWCHYPYKYIGHVETIKEDMPFILKAIHSPVAYNSTHDSNPVITYASGLLNLKRSGIQRCMDLDEACRRYWKVLQIRGIISKTQSFPLTREETRNITAEELVRAALRALSRSGDRSSVAVQRREALKEAFAGIDLEDRLEVRRLLFLDFEMFGFDAEPEEVFPRATVFPDRQFSYFDLYK